MIKKDTQAIFLDGDYAGEYDWKGGIPLSEGEFMSVKFNGKLLSINWLKKKFFLMLNQKIRWLKLFIPLDYHN